MLGGSDQPPLQLVLRRRERAHPCEGVTMSTILIIVVLILLFGGGGGYYAHGRYGYAGLGGVLGLILVVLLVLWLLGGLGGGTQRLAQSDVQHQFFECYGEADAIADLHQHAGFALDHRVGDRADRGRDDGASE